MFTSAVVFWVYSSILSKKSTYISLVQSLSCVRLFVTPWTAALQASLSLSWLFASGGQSIRASASAYVPLMNIQDWSPLWWTGWISLQSKGLSTVFFNTTVQKHQFSGAQPPSWSHSHSPYMTTGKTIALTRQTFVSRVMSLLFNTVYLSDLFFQGASFSWLQVTICSDFGDQENKVCHCFHCFLICLPWNDGTGGHDLCFSNVEF